MTLRKRLLAGVAMAVGLIALALSAGAGWFDFINGNDTGGIIPWGSPTPDYRGIAANHCATYSKYAIITSVANGMYSHTPRSGLSFLTNGIVR